ncbi:MAG: heme ABC transporter ATP-binding protein, partial [Carnobacterium sp.]
LMSFELDEILNCSDRIAVMYDGKIAAIVDPKQTTEQELGLLMAGSSLEKARAALQAEEEEKKEAELIES